MEEFDLESNWNDTLTSLVRFGIDLPEYSSAGAMFSLGQDGKVAKQLHPRFDYPGEILSAVQTIIGPFPAYRRMVDPESPGVIPKVLWFTASLLSYLTLRYRGFTYLDIILETVFSLIFMGGVLYLVFKLKPRKSDQEVKGKEGATTRIPLTLKVLLLAGALLSCLALKHNGRTWVDIALGPILSMAFGPAITHSGIKRAMKRSKTTQDKRDKEAAIISAMLLERSEIESLAVPRVFLFLRPFYIKSSLPSPNTSPARVPLLPSAWKWHKDLETQLAVSLYSVGEFVGFGTPGYYVSGAGKISVEEADWKNKITILAKRSTGIIVVPSNRPGTEWEISMLREFGFLSKTIFVMPPSKEESSGVHEKGKSTEVEASYAHAIGQREITVVSSCGSSELESEPKEEATQEDKPPSASQASTSPVEAAGTKNESASQLSSGRGPAYWAFMILAMLTHFAAQNGCFDGTYKARVACGRVNQSEQPLCVQCVKSGGTWETGFGGFGFGGCSGVPNER
ncbi:MAG TPA: hypothetical protein VF173_15040 [Thermoanaerobaculia bacterium]|nr:hypothetical protein [Thermoanaerobaculia bacterium]